VTTLPLPAAQDVVRVIRPTVDETEEALHAYYTDSARGIFNYIRAQGLCRFAFSHALPLQQILDGCDAEHTPVGRASNAEVLRLVWEYAASRSITTYLIKAGYFSIRKDMSIRVAPPFYFVEDGKPYAFWLQPRKHYALSFAQLGLLASMVKHTILRDDYEALGLEVCDLSVLGALSSKREVRGYHLETLNIISGEVIHEAMQRFARAYDRLVARGVQRYKRPSKRPTAGPDLFDGRK
jgi:hypothetical protein